MEEEKKVNQGRKELLNKLMDEIKSSKDHFKPVFERMERDIQFARNGADKQWVADKMFVVHLIPKHISSKTASLYAKDPKPMCEPRKRLDYKVYDGNIALYMQYKQELLQQTQQQMMGMPVLLDEQKIAYVKEFEEVSQKRKMIENVGKTLEILFEYYLEEQNFKVQAKQLVRRAITTGVAFVKLDYQRALEKKPEQDQLNDLTDRLSLIERLEKQQKDEKEDAVEKLMGEEPEGMEDEIESEGNSEDDDSGETDPKKRMDKERLKIVSDQIKNEEEIIAREGPVFTFPYSDAIIVDKRCVQLNGFVGAEWVAQEFKMTKERIQEIYNVELKCKNNVKDADYSKYKIDFQEDGEKKEELICIYEMWHKRDGVVYILTESHDDFIDIRDPSIKIERFYPFFVLSFNTCENKNDIYPISDVEILRPMQEEYNRSREYARRHRKHSLPFYVAKKGVLDDSDMQKIANHDPYEIAEVALPNDKPISDVIQPFASTGIDPLLLSADQYFDDILRSTGTQEAQYGGLSSASATEASIAESARSTVMGSNVDDLDQLLSELAASTAQVMLAELNVETVQKIVGNGAVFPSLTRREIAEEVILKIKAGSSGRPNKAQEIANFERALPILMQLPGINPVPLAEKFAELLDIDIDRLINDGMPSISAMNTIMAQQAQMQNAMAAQAQQAPQGQPGQNPTDPNAPQNQGAQGANNNPQPSGFRGENDLMMPGDAQQAMGM